MPWWKKRGEEIEKDVEDVVFLHSIVERRKREGRGVLYPLWLTSAKQEVYPQLVYILLSMTHWHPGHIDMQVEPAVER